jgi:serpin B
LAIGIIGCVLLLQKNSPPLGKSRKVSAMSLRNKGLLSFISFSVITLLTATLTTPSIAASASQDQIVAGNTDFAWKIYALFAKKKGNIFLSPYSISSAIGMTYCGARGTTAAEMKEALEFPLDPESLPPAYKALNDLLQQNANRDDQRLTIANGLCLTEGDVSKEFKAILKQDFDAELLSGDVKTINSWVAKKTEGKIPSILENLNSNSVCVLLNAIYFKGTWEARFEKQRTRDAVFKIAPGSDVTAPFMQQTNEFRLLETKDYQAVSLPYSGDRVSMIILLPTEEDGLAKVQEQLTAEKLRELLDSLDKIQPRKIDLIIPKLKLDTAYDLVPPLQSLGMKLAFSPSGADFSGMGSPKGMLYISQIKHKAFVEVDEQGTEAATAVEMATRAAIIHPVFRADHPFMMLIKDNKTGTILFLGRIENPKQE